MRNMSFALTTPQIQHHTKTVTRRLGWLTLRPGQQVRAVKKCMGLRPGEKVEPLAVLRVVSVRREPLRRLQDDPEYGAAEIAAEGFADHPEYGQSAAWVQFFCATHAGCTPDTEITRIEFEYVGA